MSTSQVLFDFIDEFNIKNSKIPFIRTSSKVIIVDLKKSQRYSNRYVKRHQKTLAIKKSWRKVHSKRLDVKPAIQAIVPSTQRMAPVFLSQTSERVHTTQSTNRFEFAKALMTNRIALRTAKILSVSPEQKGILIAEIKEIQSQIFDIYRSHGQIEMTIRKQLFELRKDRAAYE
ncbi:hypothetical protein VXQ42_14975 [Acinetobacter baumannii]|uniref:hypothetical protein n=2 Tax=Acinetobacter baumannii TaxID=470 RepID=UPI003A8B553C